MDQHEQKQEQIMCNYCGYSNCECGPERRTDDGHCLVCRKYKCGKGQTMHQLVENLQ